MSDGATTYADATNRFQELPPNEQSLQVFWASAINLDNEGYRSVDDIATALMDSEKTRLRAYEKWEAGGRPEGAHERHWLEAEAEEKSGGEDLPQTWSSQGDHQVAPRSREGEGSPTGSVPNLSGKPRELALDGQLQSKRVRTLVVTGGETDVCVSAALWSYRSGIPRHSADGCRLQRRRRNA